MSVVADVEAGETVIVADWIKNAKEKGFPAEEIVADIKALIKKHAK